MLSFTISETKTVNQWSMWLWCPLVVSIKLTLMALWECVLDQQEKETGLLHPQPGLGARKSQRMMHVMAKDIAEWDPEVYKKKKKENFFVHDPGPSYKRVEAIQELRVGSCAVAASSSIFLFLWEPAIDISRSLTCPDRSWRTCWSNHPLGHYALQAQEVELGSLGVNDGAGELGCERELSWGPTTSQNPG